MHLRARCIEAFQPANTNEVVLENAGGPLTVMTRAKIYISTRDILYAHKDQEGNLNPNSYLDHTYDTAGGSNLDEERSILTYIHMRYHRKKQTGSTYGLRDKHIFIQEVSHATGEKKEITRTHKPVVPFPFR